MIGVTHCFYETYCYIYLFSGERVFLVYLKDTHPFRNTIKGLFLVLFIETY